MGTALHPLGTGKSHHETVVEVVVFAEHMLPSLKEAERRFGEREPVKLKAVS